MLSDIQIKKIKPDNRLRKYHDQKGLYLYVTTAGKKYFKFKYIFLGKENILTIGEYPLFSLAEARDRHADARKLLASGIDPNHDKRKLRAESQEEYYFENIAKQWLASREGVRDDAENIRRLTRDVYPAIGQTPIAQITTDLIYRKVITPLVSRKVLETANRCKTLISMVWDYAVAIGLAPNDRENPTRALAAAMPIIAKRRHYPAITDPTELAGLLRAIHDYDQKGTYITTAALKLAPMLFMRPSHIQYAKWSEFDIRSESDADMLIDADATKTQIPLIVPLPRQAIAILLELHKHTGSHEYLFPHRSERGKSISEGTLNMALKYMGFAGRQTAHGFRATARTILEEVLAARVDLIEQQLNHAVRDQNGRAYNRTTFLQERRELLQLWADYLDALRLEQDTSIFLPKKRTDISALLANLSMEEIEKLTALVRTNGVDQDA